MDSDTEKALNEINEKLNKILEYQEWEKNKWNYSGSFEKSFKTWAGFYLASLAADETLGRNGTNTFGFTK